MTISDAYTIMELPSSSSIEEISKQYRTLAMKLHPDVSALEDAHQRFIEMNEAYEMIIKFRSGKTYSVDKQGFKKEKKTNTRNWTEADARGAKRRARKYSKEKLEEFEKELELRTKVLEIQRLVIIGFFAVALFFGWIFLIHDLVTAEYIDINHIGFTCIFIFLTFSVVGIGFNHYSSNFKKFHPVKQ